MSHMSETYGRLPSSLLLSVALLRFGSLNMPRRRTCTISVFNGARNESPSLGACTAERGAGRVELGVMRAGTRDIAAHRPRRAGRRSCALLYVNV